MLNFFRDRIKFIIDLGTSRNCEWQVAIRYRERGLLLEGNNNPFYLIRNNRRYWYADPFLFHYQDIDYLFVEMYDRKTKKGSIGYGVLNGMKCSKIKKCLETSFHLSYPCIYKDNNNIFMIPESYQNGKVVIYKCVHFPDKWEKDKTLLNEIAVDTTPFDIKGVKGYFTTIFEGVDKKFNNNLYSFINGYKCKLKFDDYTTRMAGSVFVYNGMYVRPSQICDKRYGGGIKFFKINQLFPYVEEAVGSILPVNGSFQFVVNGDVKFWEGLHTYNFNEKYEIIDLRYCNRKFSFYKMLKNLNQYLKNKKRKSM